MFLWCLQRAHPSAARPRLICAAPLPSTRVSLSHQLAQLHTVWGGARWQCHVLVVPGGSIYFLCNLADSLLAHSSGEP